MIHFLPDATAAAACETPYEEAVARLASIRAALVIAEQAAGIEGDAPRVEVPAAWPEASAARRRCFEARSVECAQGAAAGLEMLAAQRIAGTDPHPRSIAVLAETLRADLGDLGQLFSL